MSAPRDTVDTRRAHYVGDPFAQQTACGRYAPMTPPLRPTRGLQCTADPDAVTCHKCLAAMGQA
jgi:hypothetical protein